MSQGKLKEVGSFNCWKAMCGKPIKRKEHQLKVIFLMYRIKKANKSKTLSPCNTRREEEQEKNKLHKHRQLVRQKIYNMGYGESGGVLGKARTETDICMYTYDMQIHMYTLVQGNQCWMSVGMLRVCEHKGVSAFI